LEINGETKNIKQYILDDLSELYDIQVPIGQISTNEINDRMIETTKLLNREIAVYINRQGKVIQISLGDTATVELPAIGERTSVWRLSGVRCIHTHPSGDTELSGPDISSLRRLRFDAMVAIGKKDNDIVGTVAFFTGEYETDGTEQLQKFGPVKTKVLHEINLTYLITIINKKLSKNNMQETADTKERALLAGIDLQGKATLWSLEKSMAELQQLAETAGAEVVGIFTQKKDRPDSALFLGKGKIQEIAMAIQETSANLVIFDDELTPSQQHNIEQVLGTKVLDRTALILDIFTQRARSSEGKLQVELAQLRYTLPRIGGQGLVLSRLGGGIGTRGPGETKLEVDRRRIYTKIYDIEKQIEKLKIHRNLHHAGRIASRIPLVALVGYTNSGKSTLLNALTGANVLVEDKLFATLDPTTRLVTLANNQKILLTDTVGFIQKLPHTLVSAFHATLEEVQHADLLLHVIDGSNENYELQIKAVVSVLNELKSDDKPTIYVFNKSDRLEPENVAEKMLCNREGLVISAKNKINLDELLQKVEDFFASQQEEMNLLIPFSDGSIIAELHEAATIKATTYTEHGTALTVLVPAASVSRFIKYKTTIEENKE